MDILSIFAERLKELMEYHNLNTLSLEKRTKINNSTISNWLNKKYLPNTSKLIALTTSLNCSIDFLIGRSELPDISDTQLISSFTARLQQLAAEKRITLYALSLHLDLDDAIVYSWSNAKYTPTINNLVLLADYFNCSIDYLIGRPN